MSRRRFSDATGRRWEIRPEASGDWRFEPVPGNPDPARTLRPPHWAGDPFELSERELRGLLEDATPVGRPAPGRATRRTSPFLDDRDDGSPPDDGGASSPRNPWG